MTQARRAATRGPLHHLRSALTPGAPTHGAHAIEDPDDLAGISRPRRAARLVVPGVAAAVAMTGTAYAVVGSAGDQQMEAVPAAATLPDRLTDEVSRSVQRPAAAEQTLSAAAQTPIASAMAAAPSATATASSEASAGTASAGTATAEAASAKVAMLSSSAFTPKPKPVPAAPAKKATSSSATTSIATASVSLKSTGSLANCPAPIGWLAANTQRVYEASCRNFSYVTTYGGARAGDPGEHGTGHAIDIMVSGTRGLAIASFMRANASALGVTEVIYQQKIWTVQRASDGWRPMSDRGSATANHFDHVHVTTS